MPQIPFRYLNGNLVMLDIADTETIGDIRRRLNVRQGLHCRETDESAISASSLSVFWVYACRASRRSPSCLKVESLKTMSALAQRV